MFIISGGKGIGKTRTLLERASAENAIIICEDPIVMRERAHKYGIVGLELVSYEEAWNLKESQLNRPMYIHDINKFIKYKLPTIKGYSFCTE